MMFSLTGKELVKVETKPGSVKIICEIIYIPGIPIGPGRSGIPQPVIRNSKLQRK
jgi:hypothetical protein